jgi:hypothetical protein
MAVGADLGREEVERARCRTLNIMHAVAIGARRDIWISFPDESGPVNTFFIFVINLGVTALTCLWDPASGDIRRLCTVRVVTVSTHSSLEISARERLLVHAVKGGVVLVLMTIGTQGILIEGELPNRASRDRFMREAIEARVAIDTSNSLSAVR